MQVGGTLFERVAEIISRYSMPSPGDRLGIGVSGGADSVVLLHILKEFSATFPLSLWVLHVNHQLRKEESEADEVFVRALAESLQLPVEVKRVRLAAGGNVEQAARMARREFFSTGMKQHALRWVALGHTRSDQAETVLFRMLRGSGLSGLAGMRVVTSDGFIRPLLTTSRAEVRAWAQEQKLSWREDSSNELLHFRRNRIRLETLPMLSKQFNPNLEGVLAGMAELAGAEEEYWAERIESIYGQITKRTGEGSDLASFLHLLDLAGLHLSERRRLIRRALLDLRGDLRSIDLGHVDGILRICHSHHGHDRVQVPGIDALRSFGVLRLSRVEKNKVEERHYRIPVQFDQWQRLPFDAGEISAVWANYQEGNFVHCKEVGTPAVECSELDGERLPAWGVSPHLCIRNWQPGDEIRLAGQVKVKKLKFLFGEHRIFLWERKHWPVLVWKEEIIWTRQFGCAATFERSAESRRILRISFRARQESQ